VDLRALVLADRPSLVHRSERLSALVGIRVVVLGLAWLAVVLEIVLGALWTIGGFGDPPAYDPKADAVRAVSGLSVFFGAIFEGFALSQAYRDPRTVARRLAVAVVILVAIGLLGDLLLSRIFGAPFVALLNAPVLVAALLLGLGAVPRTAA
jgi:hypothetical protein